MRGFAELIVVDGGSHDKTAEVARRFENVLFLQAARGRASQMNAGARRATGDVFLFLHADTQLPPDGLSHIARVLEDPGVVAGAFRTWTIVDAGTSVLAPLLHLADIRSRYTRLPYGDQAMFVRREAFERVGRFPAQPLMEDLELSRRLRRIGRIEIAHACVRVSGRRFISKPVTMTFIVNVFPLLYRMGVSPAQLARFYRHIR